MKLIKAVKKFIKIYKDDINDFYGIFESLDSGGEIDIEDIENLEIKLQLYKIFKCLNL